MRQWRTISVLAMAGILSAAVAVFAQSTDRRGNENSDEGFGLLKVEQVQRDLHLTDEQKVQILALSMELRENRANLSKKIADILTPEQYKRLKQIRLQVEGPAAINSHEVAMKLGLTKEQRKSLKVLQEQIGQEARDIVASLQGLTADERNAKKIEIYTKIETLRARRTEDALAILTPAQRKEFEQMQGPKLDLGALPAPEKSKEPASDASSSSQ